MYIHEIVRMLALPYGAGNCTNFFSGQKFDQMWCDADRTDTRSAASVRNAKRLVQVQMANVRAEVTGPAKSHLRVHIRAIHVNLAAVRVHDVANFTDRRLEDTVRGRVGDH